LLSISLQHHGGNAAADTVSPAAAVEHRQRLARLQDALDELPERQRQAFVLHRFDGDTQDDVAQQMNISRRMVTKHLSRALAYCQLRVQYASLEQMRAHLPDAMARPGEDE
jgi:RNA polymerase sigma-70 factor (ECF subfamily)